MISIYGQFAERTVGKEREKATFHTEYRARSWGIFNSWMSVHCERNGEMGWDPSMEGARGSIIAWHGA